jgi:hypothetical protein
MSNTTPDAREQALIEELKKRIALLVVRNAHSLAPAITPADFTIEGSIGGDGRRVMTIRPANPSDTRLGMAIGLTVGQIEGASMGIKGKPSSVKYPAMAVATPEQAQLSAGSFADMGDAFNLLLAHMTFKGVDKTNKSLKDLGTVYTGRTAF